MKNYNPGTLAFFLGPITGLLVMSGAVDPAHSDEVFQELNLLAGTLITLVSLIGALSHHIQLKKIEASKYIQGQGTSSSNLDTEGGSTNEKKV